jgi:hypothetical protein
MAFLVQGECGLLEKQLAETRAAPNRALEDAAPGSSGLLLN